MHKKTPRVLFCLRQRNHSWGEDNPNYCTSFSSGLFNSANFVNVMLQKAGIESKLVEVIDSNFLDREINLYKPTHVICEGVVFIVEKFPVLQKLHPNVKFIVRNHSEIPFLAVEGCGLDWLLRYLEVKNVSISCNSPRTNRELEFLTGLKYGKHSPEINKVIYLPNYYPVGNVKHKIFDKNKKYVDVGLFGAIRTLKNVIEQATAALKFADQLGKKLRLHVNGFRIENDGNPVAKTLNLLFDNIKDSGHELILHKWLNHKDFLDLCRKMDIGMCVSFSETFCIVAADLVSVGVPVVLCPDIPWAAESSKANPTDSDDIVNTMINAIKAESGCLFNQLFKSKSNDQKLKEYSENSRQIWLEYLYK